MTRMQFYALAAALAGALLVMTLLLGRDGVLGLWLFMGLVTLVIILEEGRQLSSPVIYGIVMVLGGWFTVVVEMPTTRYVKKSLAAGPNTTTRGTGRMYVGQLDPRKFDRHRRHPGVRAIVASAQRNYRPPRKQ